MYGSRWGCCANGLVGLCFPCLISGSAERSSSFYRLSDCGRCKIFPAILQKRYHGNKRVTFAAAACLPGTLFQGARWSSPTVFQMADWQP